MHVNAQSAPEGASRYTLYKEALPVGEALLCGGHFAAFCIVPAWRGRGYGSFFLKELLRQNGGFDKTAATVFTAPLPTGPDAPAALALAEKFGFSAGDGMLLRRRVPDLTAVGFCHRFLASALRPGGFYVDATCGNGHDTEFLCRLAGPNGRVLGLDIQPKAVSATNARLAAAGLDGVGHALLADHAALAAHAPKESADCVLFNFGWLPGADHSVFSHPESTLPALNAALDALKPGGVLAAVLYSGRTIGTAERDAALAWFRALPLAQYTVLECRFANWADTAPLPCFALRRG